MIEIGKGATRNLIFRIKPKTEGLLSDDDTILFALKDIDESVIMTKSATISTLEQEDGVYIFEVTLGSSLTIDMDYKAPYFYDLTLIDSLDQKKPLTSRKEIKIVKTVGASIVPQTSQQEG